MFVCRCWDTLHKDQRGTPDHTGEQRNKTTTNELVHTRDDHMKTASNTFVSIAIQVVGKTQDAFRGHRHTLACFVVHTADMVLKRQISRKPPCVEYHCDKYPDTCASRMPTVGYTLHHMSSAERHTAQLD